MATLSLVDLDQRPDLIATVVALLAAHPPGRSHVVCGIPSHMGAPVTAQQLDQCLGAIALLDGQRVAGALAICPYSDEQATFWGPVVDEAYSLASVGAMLVTEARHALRDGGFESVRCLADTRNRILRQFMLTQGLAGWKDTHVYLRSLEGKPVEAPGGTRLARARDHRVVAEILDEGFPESMHCQPDLVTREEEGYRHYVAEHGGEIVGAAAVQSAGRRSWIKLIAVRRSARRTGAAPRLLGAIIAGEAARRQRDLGLEVLADNPAAIAAFERAGFSRAWTATIMTGPV